MAQLPRFGGEAAAGAAAGDVEVIGVRAMDGCRLQSQAPWLPVLPLALTPTVLARTTVLAPMTGRFHHHLGTTDPVPTTPL